MNSNSKRIQGIFFLLSGIVFLTGCQNKLDKKNKQLKTVIVAESTEETNDGDGFYFGNSDNSSKSWDINVNQAGYRTKDEKIAIIRDNCGSATYSIYDEEGTQVFTGGLTKSYTDTNYNETLYYADFSRFQKEGTYYIMCGERVTSPMFDIEDSVYQEMAHLAVRPFAPDASFLTNVVTDPQGIEKKREKEKKSLRKMSKKATCIENGKEIDVSGGWYTTENDGWYTVSSITSLANIMYLKQYYEKEIQTMPGQAKNSKILLDQTIREELEWLLKMQNAEDGSVYHKAATSDGTAGSEGNTVYVSKSSTCATADFAAIMAKGSTLYEYTDHKFAKKCIQAAEKAWAYLEKQTKNKPFHNETGILSREYSDPDDSDERFWAAMELYLATGEDEYRKYIKSFDLEKAAIEFGCTEVAGYACFDFYTKIEKKDSDFYKKIKRCLQEEVKKTKKNSEQGYRINPAYASSNLQQLLNRSMLLTLMNKAEGEQESEDIYIRNYLNYVMGANPQSKNAFQEMLSDKKEQTLEASSALLISLQGV